MLGRCGRQVCSVEATPGNRDGHPLARRQALGTVGTISERLARYHDPSIQAFGRVRTVMFEHRNPITTVSATMNSSNILSLSSRTAWAAASSELQIGVRLFDRSGGYPVLTRVGRALLPMHELLSAPPSCPRRYAPPQFIVSPPSITQVWPVT